jgi:hypothetical protein
VKRKQLILGIVIVSMVATLLGACSGTATPAGQRPIQVMSVSGPLPPINPGGPPVQVTLKNVSGEPVVSLTASLGISRAGPSNTPFVFNFDVTPSKPLAPDASVSSTLTLIGGSFADNVSYPLAIEGKLQSGATFAYTEQVRIIKP